MSQNTFYQLLILNNQTKLICCLTPPNNNNEAIKEILPGQKVKYNKEFITEGSAFYFL